VTLIAADERISKYRHPVPTDKKIDRYVMLVTGARRWGLVTSMSRLVHFGKLPDELKEKHKACVYVDTAFIHATRPGNSVSAIFNKGVEAYAEAGYPQEWTFHHQGGPTGYKGRDYRGTPNVQGVVQPNQAYAWNPSISGTKSEDTIIAMPEKTEVISEIPGWPMVEVTVDGTSYRRPDILVR
jgi:antitoxin VapB